MHEVGRSMVCKNAHGLHSLPVTKPLSTWSQGRYDYNTSVVRMSYECRLLRLNSLSSARKVVAETRTMSYLSRVVAGIAASGTRSLAFWFNDWHQRRRAATSNPSWASSRHTDRRTADLQHCSPTIQLLHTEARASNRFESGLSTEQITAQSQAAERDNGELTLSEMRTRSAAAETAGVTTRSWQRLTG